MKALSLQAINSLSVVDIPIPTPGHDQLLIRTGASLICTSDLHDIDANPFGIHLPVILGHEAAGSVAAVGSAVTSFRVGDRVATHPVHPCLKCEQCLAGRGHLCPNMLHFGLNLQGTFAEYYLVRADRARLISADLPFSTAALAEPVCVCLQALAQANLTAASRLLIIGDGPFALIMARIAIRSGLSQVVLAGRHDFRLSFATGATTLNLKRHADPLATLTALAPRGYDAVIATVGNLDAVRWGLDLLRPKGRLVLFAAMPGQTPIDLFRVHVKELAIVGACNDQDRLDQAIALLTDPSLALGQLVTHRTNWQDYSQALQIAAHQHDSALKVALLWDQGIDA